jgi:hypothetical protein
MMKETAVLILRTRWPFIFIGRKVQLDLYRQPKFALFIGTRNMTKRVWIWEWEAQEDV